MFFLSSFISEDEGTFGVVVGYCVGGEGAEGEEEGEEEVDDAIGGVAGHAREDVPGGAGEDDDESGNTTTAVNTCSSDNNSRIFVCFEMSILAR